tara:strand:- start:4380 stop:4580 length:201 start_codon:yes stop_codon:yes gene_type:complete
LQGLYLPGAFFMSIFLELCIAIAMLAVGFYVVALGCIAILAHKAKVEMSQPTKEQYPTYISGEDLL